MQLSRYGLGVVSSSAMCRIVSALRSTRQLSYFAEHSSIFSAVSSLREPTPKPDPAIYEHAMRIRGVTPEETVAVEDSRSGATSALRAGIRCIAYVGAYHSKMAQREVGSTLLELGCVRVITHWDQLEGVLKELEAE